MAQAPSSHCFRAARLRKGSSSHCRTSRGWDDMRSFALARRRRAGAAAGPTARFGSAALQDSGLQLLTKTACRELCVSFVRACEVGTAVCGAGLQLWRRAQARAVERGRRQANSVRAGSLKLGVTKRTIAMQTGPPVRPARSLAVRCTSARYSNNLLNILGHLFTCTKVRRRNVQAELT